MKNNEELAKKIIENTIAEAKLVGFYVSPSTHTKKEAFAISNAINAQLKILIINGILPEVELPDEDVRKYIKEIDDFEEMFRSDIKTYWKDKF